MKLRLWPLGCGVAYLAALPNFGVADPAEDASLMYSYFTCSVYANMAGNTDDEVKYFNLGISNGNRFFEAVGMDLPEGEIRESIPVAVLWNLHGPSPDFAMGMIYSQALSNVVDDFGEFPSDDAGRMLAYVEMVSRNCDLLKGGN